ncbi:MAG TPA: helix-turn-helix transcriptional regulator [Cyclobacteriaceae bacterium]|jgi:DNA-binding CsgD family transcriptional regulator
MKPQLTTRELQILKLILKQKTSREIGDKIGISRRTVEKVRASLLEKTKSVNAVGLVAWAINNDIVSVSSKKPRIRL